MQRRSLLLLPLLGAASPHAQANEPVSELLVIGYPRLPKVDAMLLLRLYTGRAIEIDKISAYPVHLPIGTAARARFLKVFVDTDEDRYRAYWTVRRHIGKGTPPRELASAAELIDFVQATPGALGYLDARDARPGLNVIARG